MNKTDLINAVAEKTEFSKKDTTLLTEALLETITELLVDGEPVKLIGFGNFETRDRAARKGRNPSDGTEIEIPATRVPAWKPSKVLKEKVKA